MSKEKGWLDPWGKQHELLCRQYMADEAVMGSCTCSTIRAAKAEEREDIAEKVRELQRYSSVMDELYFTALDGRIILYSDVIALFEEKK